ncbi:hypothetical protein B4065_2520 [Caldibacillus thermoamylovorans]|nr:hypothetical protein [Caldibacillus thermoamylovorans]KIO65498.1 hypothetical protein B4065_2520 [Caldibacillus thermoamylovorans]
MYDANKIDFDRHWKEIIAGMPDSFLLLLEPELFEQIDFAAKLQPMEQELFPIHSKQRIGKHIADKIFDVKLKRKYAMKKATIHIEVQGDGRDISERMFKMYYKLFDKGRKNIYSIVLVTDPSAQHPTTFDHHFLGTSVQFQFRVHHLNNFTETELFTSDNPFALALLAGKYQASTRFNAEQRYTYKVNLAQIIKERYSFVESDIGMKLLIFVDAILYLPDDLHEKFMK